MRSAIFSLGTNDLTDWVVIFFFNLCRLNWIVSLMTLPPSSRSQMKKLHNFGSRFTTWNYKHLLRGKQVISTNQRFERNSIRWEKKIVIGKRGSVTKLILSICSFYHFIRIMEALFTGLLSHSYLTDDKSALVQVMAWRPTGAKPLPEPMMTHFSDT